LASLFALSFAPAIAQAAPCDGVGSEQPFTEWHDQASYVLVSGGDFESAAADWTLTGDAAVVAGGNTLRPDSSANSLSLPAGASATTPAICVGKGNPVARIFMRSAAAAKGGQAGLQVEVLYLNADGAVRKVKKAGSLRASGDWAPSRRFSLAQGQFSHGSKPIDPPPGNGPPATPPGQGGTPPGQGGTPPGQGGTPPGQGGTPPGQSDPHGPADGPQGPAGGDDPSDPPNGHGGNTGHGDNGGSNTSGAGSIQLRFTAGAGSEWQIDDVFVDPRARY
jgi:hypothetical protein